MLVLGIMSDETQNTKWYPPSDDTMFKLICYKRPDLLLKFLKLVPYMPKLPKQITLLDPHSKESLKTKLTIRDCKFDFPFQGKITNPLTQKGEIIGIEMQNKVEKDFSSRFSIYSAQNIASQLQSGKEYYEFYRSRMIILLNSNLFPESERYFRIICPYDISDGKPFDGLEFMYIYELNKVRKIQSNDPLIVWLKFFSAKTLEECMNLAALNLDVAEAAKFVEEQNQDPETLKILQELELERKARSADIGLAEMRGEKRGEKRGEMNGEKKAKEQFAKNLLLDNVPLDRIIQYTGLSEKRINQLRNL